MQWPNTIPPDLRDNLHSLMGQRNYGPAEMWGVVKEWLEKHEADAPGGLQIEEKPENANS